MEDTPERWALCMELCWSIARELQSVGNSAGIRLGYHPVGGDTMYFEDHEEEMKHYGLTVAPIRFSLALFGMRMHKRVHGA